MKSATIVICCSLQHLSIDVYRAVEAFVAYADILHGSLVFYGKLNNPTEITKTAVYALQTIVADGFLVSSEASFYYYYSGCVFSSRRRIRSGGVTSFGVNTGL